MTTEAKVLQESIETIKRGFTPDLYFESDNGLRLTNPGSDVGAVCAIGGVEQAIWKLTGKNVKPSRNTAAYTPEKARYKQAHLKLYVRVMKRLNRKARQLFAGKLDREIKNVEHVTFASGSERAVKARVLKVFREALKEIEG